MFRSSLFNLLLVLALLASPAFANQTPACPSLPQDMLAARTHGAGGPETLRLERIPLPEVGSGDVLVRVSNASINPVDWKLQQAGRLPNPGTPGGDFSGEVVAVGSGVRGIGCGMAVVGIANQRDRGGSYAEYVSLPADLVAPKPEAFSFAEAAAYPTHVNRSSPCSAPSSCSSSP